MVNWEELPPRLKPLQLIAQRLALEDFAAFRGVCSLWRFAAPKETYNTKSKAPWLVSYAHNQRAGFFSPSRGRTYRLQSPESQVEALSSRGWIFVSKEGREYHVFNPVSRVSIELPSLEKLLHDVELNGQKSLQCHQLRINRMALSSSPCSSRSYAVMISIHHSIGSQGFAFHRSGQGAWTVVSPARRSTILQLICYKGLFVAVDVQGRITSFNEGKSRMESRLVLELNCFEGHPYLVECSGSLLVAWTIWGKEHGPVKDIRVFKVDLEKETEEEVKCLGNASLFLNYNSSFAVEFNDESCLPGIKPNHVYFIDDTDEKKKKKKKSYGMDDGQFGTYFDATSCHGDAAEWFQPDFCRF